jgi:hypothetical protein
VFRGPAAASRNLDGKEGSTVRVRQRAWRDPAWFLVLRDRRSWREERCGPNWKRFGNGARAGVSERHSQNSVASRTIAESLAGSATPRFAEL